ncbi:E3 ubiquitin-protein ligase ATL23 [Glycine soja]|uniref:E3 ubiquitin-protein ligase ATL23 n=1 Tax=Glycine soja TaxID=3848 RepID=A0A0B2SW79_GLYSO|nr:E3 ubiquitin-protein ligase ATL23 [Glycine soja]
MDGGGAFGELSLSHAKQQNFKREQRSSQSNANNLSFPYSLPTPTNMLGSVLLAVFLPCIGMSAALIVYMCLLYYFTDHFSDPALPAKPASDSGLSPSQLDKLPRITGKELVMGNECPRATGQACLRHRNLPFPARQAPQNHRKGPSHGKRMRRLPGRDRNRATGSGGSRLQPRLPFGMRRHLALRAPSLPSLQSQTRPSAFLFLPKSMLNLF